MSDHALKHLYVAPASIDEEEVRALLEEGAQAAREYRERVEREMWNISKDERQARAR